MENQDFHRIPAHPPSISRIDSDLERPTWSIMIPVYNCGSYLKETLESVLTQDQGVDRMQIEVIDDASTDQNVEELIERIGKGRVVYFRQSFNVGSLRNFQTCVERSKGRYIHILHGDDRVRDGFYSSFEKLFLANEMLGAAFCRYAYINEQGQHLYYQAAEMDRAGKLENWITRLGERQRIQYVSMVVKRSVYEDLGSFYGVEYGEDWEMWMRIASKYPVGYIPTVLADYRKHLCSISGKSFLTGKNMRDLSVVMHNIQPLIPAKDRSKILKISRRFYAHYAVRIANQLWTKLKHRKAVIAQLSEALKMSRDVNLIFKIIKLYTRMTLKL
jgi:glycosyltransferase involved in cell wall biosynthesis